MNLDDIRRQVPVDDRAAYDAAYAEAELAGRLGGALHRLRDAAGLTEHELAARTGATDDEVVRAEEGDPALTVVFVGRLAHGLGVHSSLSIGAETVDLDLPGPDPDTPGTDTPGTDTPGTDTPGTNTPGSAVSRPDLPGSGA